jgi:hypothetical protein
MNLRWFTRPDRSINLRHDTLSPLSRGHNSSLFPIGQCPQLIHDFLQPLEPPFLLGCRYRAFAVLDDVGAIRCADVGYLLS